MEQQSTTSPPSIRICDYNPPVENDTSSSPHSPSRSSSSHSPMTVPGSNEAVAPPPLPPPRFIEGLAHGHDSGWAWGNSSAHDSFGRDVHSTSNGGASGGVTLAPIKPTSSLFGGGAPARPPLVRRDESDHLKPEEDDKQKWKMETDEPPSVSAATLSRTSLSDIRHTSLMQPRTGSLGSRVSPLSLEGEKPLSEKSVERSSNAYDQHLLSKIGNPSSSPRQSISLSNLTDSESTSLPFRTGRNASLSTLSIGDSHQRWNNGPHSAAISPGTRPGWSDYLGYQSSAVDSPGVSPMDLDPASQSRQFGFGGPRGIEETASLPSRSARGSYDQANFLDSDIDFPMEDASSGPARRRGSARERTGSYAEAQSPQSRQGIKRRASSPPRAPVIGEANNTLLPPQSTTSNSELEKQRRSSGFPFNDNVSSSSRYQASHHGSISSVSSVSPRAGSYASSTGLSAGASSMSSYDRPSPGGISPTSELESGYDKSGFVSPGAGQKSPSSALPTSARYPPSYYDSTDSAKGGPPPLRKVPSASQNGSGSGSGSGNSKSNSSGNMSKPSAPRIGSLHICDCCPKKPKKFDTMEELRAHEMEKQYFCRYCNKRFKNKNEAERHQNSLHLRRHSWSCAALSSYEAAFHPTSAPAYQTTGGSASHDTCGYCGAEFSNYPQPEWDRRIDHLTNVHKFGECNQAKKFFRADHFRQHLKHSHAGSSGKWTNILEHACMREESVTSTGEGGTAAGGGGGGLPSIGEHAGNFQDGDNNFTANSPSERGGATESTTMAGVASHTIDEVMDES